MDERWLEQIQLMTDLGVTQPGEPPRLEPDESAESITQRLDDYHRRRAAHGAAHGPSPAVRREFAAHVAYELHSGAELHPAAREWLIFVLGKLIERDEIPTTHKGRNFDAGAWRRDFDAFMQAVVQRRIECPNEPVTKMLAAVAESMCWSYETARSWYYGGDFRALLRGYLERERKRRASV